ncbi:MAG: BtpA/SgcQ family protein [Candidatus Limnocylindria bacterium]
MILGPGHEKPIIGMVHLKPLPGTPDYGGDLQAVISRAVEDARALEAGGANAVLIQNRWDRAIPKQRAPVETVVAATRIAHAVRDAVDVELGVHLLRNDVVASLAVAALCGGSFIRAAALTGASWSSQGIIEPDTMHILHERARIGADGVAILADVWSMHYRPAVPMRPAQLAADAQAAGAAAVLVAAAETDEALGLIAEIRASVGPFPILLGGYSTEENIGRLLEAADGAVVGAAFEDPERDRRVVEERVRSFVRAARGTAWKGGAS